MPEVHTILSVAGEGGGMTMVREMGDRGRFRITRSDHTMTFLPEPEADNPTYGDSGWLGTFEEALLKFEQWPWPVLSPRYVDPVFADRVLAAVPGVLERKGLPMRHFREDRWLQACKKGSGD